MSLRSRSIQSTSSHVPTLPFNTVSILTCPYAPVQYSPHPHNSSHKTQPYLLRTTDWFPLGMFSAKTCIPISHTPYVACFPAFSPCTAQMFQHTVLTAVTGNDLTGLSTTFASSDVGNIVANLGGRDVDWTGLCHTGVRRAELV
jgi:hypothetical protein